MIHTLTINSFVALNNDARIAMSDAGLQYTAQSENRSYEKFDSRL